MKTHTYHINHIHITYTTHKSHTLSQYFLFLPVWRTETVCTVLNQTFCTRHVTRYSWWLITFHVMFQFCFSCAGFQSPIHPWIDDQKPSFCNCLAGTAKHSWELPTFSHHYSILPQVPLKYPSNIIPGWYKRNLIHK